MEKFNSSPQATCNSLSPGIALRELGSLGLNENWKFLAETLIYVVGGLMERWFLCGAWFRRLERDGWGGSGSSFSALESVEKNRYGTNLD